MPKINYPEAIEKIAGPHVARESRESRIAVAARRLGLPYRTVRALYYEETVDPKVSVHLRFERFLEDQFDTVHLLARRLERLEQGKGVAA